MHWVIQENLYNEEGFDSLIRVLQVAELPYSVHKIIPFVHELHPEVSPEGKVIVMGAYTMIKIAQERGWGPGAYTNGNFHITPQLANWGDRMLNYGCWVGPLKDVPKQEAEDFFCKPTLDSKTFSGEVFSWDEFLDWRRNIQALGWEGAVTPDTEVLVSTPKTIFAEWRVWVVGGKVVTSSQYKLGTRPHFRPPSDTPEAVLRFAQECAGIWNPADAYVLDVGENLFHNLKIVEINCLNAAGFYKGNVQAIVEALENLEAGR